MAENTDENEDDEYSFSTEGLDMDHFHVPFVAGPLCGKSLQGAIESIDDPLPDVIQADGEKYEMVRDDETRVPEYHHRPEKRPAR